MKVNLRFYDANDNLFSEEYELVEGRKVTLKFKKPAHIKEIALMLKPEKDTVLVAPKEGEKDNG